ncbi:EAL domain-containing protein, partial [Variovorax sp. HJSM1_2]|uniref:bifunctional diguanylate cyclase/phosphodiesterase n=1 Tax=Variovorax sp. HJSM1_2 TaxID=3366263 RepID=UPI003BE40894
QVFERITDAYVATDRNLCYTHVNPQAAQMMGRSAEALIGKHVWSEFPELVGHPVQLLLQQALVDLRPVQMEAHFPSFGAWFELRVYPSAEGLTVYFHDVTQRRLAAESLAESEARYRELFEANPHPMWVYELETLRFLAVNDAAVAHYGYSRAEFEAMTIRDIRPSADLPQLLESVKRAPEQRQRDMELWRHRCKDGRLILVEINGHSLLYMGRPARLVLAHDVTERERTAERLRLSEESLSITLQSIGDAVIATDTAGHITRMNATAERLTGWRFPEAVGRPLSEVFWVVHAETGKPVPNPVQRVLADGEVVGLSNHTTLLARDGAQYQISKNAAPIRDGSGRIVGVVLVFSDATEAYRVRQALATSVELLERTGEMAKVGGWELDVAARRSSWTQATARIYETEAQPTHALEDVLAFFDPPVRDTVRAAVQAAVQHARPWDMELPVTTARGRHIWVRSQGFPVVRNGSVSHIRGALHDITERRLAVDELRTASARTQMILDNMSDGVITLDAEGRIGSLNRAACAIFACAQEDVVGRDVGVLMADTMAFHQDSSRGALLEAGSAPRELEGRRQDGTHFPMSLSLSRSEQDDVVAFIGVVRDITQQRADMEEIRRLAFSDLLTGLPNRRLLMDRLRLAVATSTRNGQHAALMLLDLDNFKLLNDTAGHDVGDILLQQVASRLQHCVRECDSVARIGGDEFVVLLEGLHARAADAGAQAEHIAEKILLAFKAPFRLREQNHESTTSIGIVLFDGDGESLDDLMKKADLAMYQAKAAGRNTARFFDPAMQAAVAAHEASERALRRGIAQQEFVLHYQMQIDRAGRCTGVEALVRWQDPARGLVTPAQFIPLAEATGLILPLGRWVLQSACAQLVAWAADPRTGHWTMAVNVSASQFAQSDFVQEVAQALNQVGAAPSLLKLELTESMLVEDVEDAIVKMNQIKALGVGFSLDDFGTGYSSLSYLKRLPLDQLKIDQSFVRDILTDPSDAVIARTVVALGQSLGLQVIAEGVETAAHHQALAEMGCDGFQGYYFARPGPEEGLLDAMASFSRLARPAHL